MNELIKADTISGKIRISSRMKQAKGSMFPPVEAFSSADIYTLRRAVRTIVQG